MAVSVDDAGFLLEPLSIEVRHGPGEVLLTVDGELDLATTPLLETALADVLARGIWPRVVLDLAGLGFIDAAGIGCITQAVRRLSDRGAALAVIHPSRPARRLLELCDLGRLLG